ncbi:chord-domain-containing protein [Multifurca ochricompacta]|uniref:Chord-domain-containing protein n=1 Tax=Multifurca ochricompacta TaxID=376703 RepID=A0AAD4M9Y6_9AGAM|nr:chord-domain-containing protein [Multifurca ochricompacta]
MPRCTRKGCGKEFDPENNTEEVCIYHPGAPIFHEGLKSWSCCNTVNKPVLDFDEFMTIAGCTRGVHSTEATKVETSGVASIPNRSITMTESTNGKEVYTTSSAFTLPQKPTERAMTIPVAPPAPSKRAEEDEDDLNVVVPQGATCKRAGCKVTFVSDEENRIGDGPGTKCVFHPGVPIFHEGSKVVFDILDLCPRSQITDGGRPIQGYLCCKRRVLEFDEFLKIEGCTEGRHLFVRKSKGDQAEEAVGCRIDHYQTPSTVHVTVFAKQADKERSTIKIEENEIHFDLYLPGPKRFTQSVHLFGPVEPSASSFTIFGTKVELGYIIPIFNLLRNFQVEVKLKKLDGRSWTLLERTDRDVGPISFTFGVSGRTGTVGAKQFILDEQNSRNHVP